ncbi:MAG: hypothetical protein MI741_07495 [Rhodospirillales bacterium]|nr:hypothetical protein [Rhodospirillales bacterium]
MKTDTTALRRTSGGMDAETGADPRTFHTVTDLILPPSQDIRADLAALPATAAARREAWAHRAFFELIAAGGATAQPALDGPDLRIGFWNTERCKYLDESADLIRGTDLDIVLLAETDRGMARSGGHHTARALAERLGWSYLFAVEFVELGLGDARERHWHRGEHNPEGLHGNAMLSRVELTDPLLVRLDDGAAWFSEPADGQRRVGGRMALGARMRIGGGEVALFAVHVESRSSPAQRAIQVDRLLQSVKEFCPSRPVVIGGDFNSCTLVRPEENTLENRRRLTEADPARFANPVPFEPLFHLAASFGFDWKAGNRLGVATQRTRPDGTPVPPLGKLDWFLTRGLDCRDASLIPAVGPAGTAISDHDMITLTVRLPGA